MTDQNLTSQLIEKLLEIKTQPVSTSTGIIESIADGVVKASGLSDVAYLEQVIFDENTLGVAVNLEEKSTGILVLGPSNHLKAGDGIKTTGKLLSIPVGDNFLGRVISVTGEPLDNLGPIKSKTTYPLEKIAPGVTQRTPVTVPLQTGIKAVDSMIPIGRGQRELIIGDRGVGKTTIAVDTIINQKDTGVICVYVAIGQKSSRIRELHKYLEDQNALSHTIIVASSASDSATLQYLAPYAGTAIAEYFMDQGKDCLVVYDDLSKHAWAYRQVSLILKRPSGREAYPGDIFYLHSRLLERACRLNKENGGGSLTALPIIETQAGDISAYIPTNVISITDGQIFLEPDLFYQGIRPAISVGLSVSRVGGNAQTSNMKQVAGKLRLELAQYRELAAFAQFSSDLDDTTRKQIERGRLMTELLKQSQGSPMPVSHQVLVLYAAINGHLSDINLNRLSEFENSLLEFVSSKHPNVIKELSTGAKITPDQDKEISKVIIEFKNKVWQI